MSTKNRYKTELIFRPNTFLTRVRLTFSTSFQECFGWTTVITMYTCAISRTPLHLEIRQSLKILHVALVLLMF